MKRQILFIQGAGSGAYKEDKKLVANLQQHVGPEYAVHYPAMENEDDADYQTWARLIAENLAVLPGEIILVGHSVGASVLIKFAAENEIGKPVAGIFLIATPYWGGAGWTYEGYETLSLPKKIDTRLPEDVPVSFYHSRDDEVVPFAHLALYAKRFPGASIRELDGRGHQLNDDLSEVARDIRRLSD